MARLDDDDGSDADPRPDVTRLVYIAPDKAASVIAALVAEAQKTGSSGQALQNFESILKRTLPVVGLAMDAFVSGAGVLASAVGGLLPS